MGVAGVTGVSGKSSSCALRLVGDTDSGRDEDNGIDDEGDDDGLVAAFSLTVVVALFTDLVFAHTQPLYQSVFVKWR